VNAIIPGGGEEGEVSCSFRGEGFRSEIYLGVLNYSPLFAPKKNIEEM